MCPNRGITVVVGVDAGRRCHTLDAAEGAAPASEATPTPAEQSHGAGERWLRPLGGQGSHLEVNGDVEPRLPAQSHS